MASEYKKLSAGPNENNGESYLILLDKKYLGITIREYVYFLGSIVIITILNFIFREYLYKLSLDIILDLQRNGRDPYFFMFFDSIKEIGSAYSVYGTLLLIYIF